MEDIDFILEDNVITYTTKIAYVTNVDIELDKDNYTIKNPDHELYKLYFGDVYGIDIYRIIVELKDNNVLFKNVEFKLNETLVNYQLIKPGFYYVEVNDDGIKELSLALNKDTFEYEKNSDLIDVSIGRDERHEDIAVTISPKTGNKLSMFAIVDINGMKFNLSNSKF